MDVEIMNMKVNFFVNGNKTVSGAQDNRCSLSERVFFCIGKFGFVYQVRGCATVNEKNSVFGSFVLIGIIVNDAPSPSSVVGMLFRDGRRWSKFGNDVVVVHQVLHGCSGVPRVVERVGSNVSCVIQCVV